MFPFRRQGPKKKNKNNNARRPRGPHKGLPNSARDLLTVLQPATKALAQVLAGRSNPSGQLAHAQAVLAHAERLIGERAHNRLNPHEREEFFEQLARLRLTLSDAESEAKVVAAEEQEARPPAPPVDQERLRALALALSTPLAAADEGSARGVQADAAPEPVTDTPGQVEDASTNGAEEGAPPPAQDDAPPAASKLSAANARSGRLQLSRSGDENASAPPAVHQIRRNRSRTKPASHGAEPPPLAPNGHATASSEVAEGGQGAEGGGAGPTEEGYPAAGGDDTKPRKRTRRRKTAAGVPEGWVIDEDGFVVPGPQ